MGRQDQGNWTKGKQGFQKSNSGITPPTTPRVPVQRKELTCTECLWSKRVKPDDAEWHKGFHAMKTGHTIYVMK